MKESRFCFSDTFLADTPKSATNNSQTRHNSIRTNTNRIYTARLANYPGALTNVETQYEFLEDFKIF